MGVGGGTADLVVLMTYLYRLCWDWMQRCLRYLQSDMDICIHIVSFENSIQSGLTPADSSPKKSVSGHPCSPGIATWRVRRRRQHRGVTGVVPGTWQGTPQSTSSSLSATSPLGDCCHTQYGLDAVALAGDGRMGGHWYLVLSSSSCTR